EPDDERDRNAIGGGEDAEPDDEDQEALADPGEGRERLREGESRGPLDGPGGGERLGDAEGDGREVRLILERALAALEALDLPAHVGELALEDEGLVEGGGFFHEAQQPRLGGL